MSFLSYRNSPRYAHAGPFYILVTLDYSIFTHPKLVVEDDTLEGDDPLALDMESKGKDQLWING